MAEEKVDLKSIYFFDELENNKQINQVRETLNKMRCMNFLIIGVDANNNFSIHSQLYEQDLKTLLEMVIKKLPDGKAVISLDKI